MVVFIIYFVGGALVALSLIEYGRWLERRAQARKLWADAILRASEPYRQRWSGRTSEASVSSGVYDNGSADS